MIDFLRKYVRKRRDLKQVSELQEEWRQLLGGRLATLTAVSPDRDVLLIPPEPISLIGSKGDEAMLVSVISSLSSAGRKVDVAVGVDWKQLPPALLEAGAGEAVPVWEYKITLEKALQQVSKYREVVIIGADVMDGHYSASKSFRFFMIADLAKKMGRQSTVTGFSFNERPSPSLTQLPFKDFSSQTRLCVRDPISQERFSSISGGLGTLTADVAFLLKPAIARQGLNEVTNWAAGRKAAGDFLLGFNIHPALLPNSSTDMRKLVESSAAALRSLITQKNVSVIFISHDSRPTSSDSISLRPIFEELHSSAAHKIHFIEASNSAAELKAIAGLADAVFTGRMHLSIAALGMGVPVGWATYQGKFEGLARHFGLPDWLLVDPSSAVQSPEKLREVLTRMIDEQGSLKSAVEARLPDVRQLASSNLSMAS